MYLSFADSKAFAFVVVLGRALPALAIEVRPMWQELSSYVTIHHSILHY